MTTFQIDIWQMVLLAVTFFGACAGAGKVLLDQHQRHIDAQHAQLSGRLEGIEQTSREEALQWQRLERDMLTRFADLPHTYVMREDYIRGQSILEAKLDGLADKLEKAQLRSLVNGRQQ